MSGRVVIPSAGRYEVASGPNGPVTVSRDADALGIVGMLLALAALAALVFLTPAGDLLSGIM